MDVNHLTFANQAKALVGELFEAAQIFCTHQLKDLVLPLNTLIVQPLPNYRFEVCRCGVGSCLVTVAPGPLLTTRYRSGRLATERDCDYVIESFGPPSFSNAKGSVSLEFILNRIVQTLLEMELPDDIV